MSMDQERCEITCIHEDSIQKVREQVLPPETIDLVAEIFKAMGDPTRIRIIHALSVSEMCVCDLAAVLEMSQSAVSHQLRVLRNLRLVKNRKDGKVVYYSLDDDHIIRLFAQGLEHVQHQ